MSRGCYLFKRMRSHVDQSKTNYQSKSIRKSFRPLRYSTKEHLRLIDAISLPRPEKRVVVYIIIQSVLFPLSYALGFQLREQLFSFIVSKMNAITNCTSSKPVWPASVPTQPIPDIISDSPLTNSSFPVLPFSKSILPQQQRKQLVRNRNGNEDINTH